MRFTFNGLPALNVGGERITTVRSSRMWALVGYLALSERGTWVTRNEVADAIWPEAHSVQAKQSLRQTLLLCAKTFGSVILADRTSLKLDDSQCECDIWLDGVQSNFFEASSEEWVLEARPTSFDSVLDEPEPVTDPSLLFLQKLQGFEFDNTATNQFNVWVAQGRYDSPIDVLNRCRAEGSLSLRGHALLANLYVLKGRTQEARVALTACQDFDEFNSDSYYLYAFSQLNHFEYRLDLALEYAKRAKEKSSLGEPFIYFGAVAVICMLTEPEVHLPMAQAHLQIATKNKFQEHACMMNYYIALDEMRQRHPRALDRLDKILDILVQGGRVGTTNKLLARVGQIYNLLGNFEQAEAAYLGALHQARLTDGIPNLTEISTYLAEFYSERGDFTKALAYHTECISIRRDHGHHWGLATSLRGAGYASMMLGEVRQAEAYLRESLRIYEKIGEKLGCASVLLPFARLYHQRGHFQKAMRCALAVKNLFGNASEDSLSKAIPPMFATRAQLEALLIELNLQGMSLDSPA